jgi:hypothetical protein
MPYVDWQFAICSIFHVCLNCHLPIYPIFCAIYAWWGYFVSVLAFHLYQKDFIVYFVCHLSLVTVSERSLFELKNSSGGVGGGGESFMPGSTSSLILFLDYS